MTMKTKQFIGFLGLSLILIVSSMTSASARQNRSNIFYNLEERNGATVGQTLYKESNKMLSQLAKYSYTYNEDRQITQNDILVWNSGKNRWEKGFQVRYNYEGQHTTIEYYKWDREKNKYILDTNRVESFTDYSK